MTTTAKRDATLEQRMLRTLGKDRLASLTKCPVPSASMTVAREFTALGDIYKFCVTATGEQLLLVGAQCFKQGETAR